MNSRVWNLLIILTLVSIESSYLVIFSTSGKFITKFNVLRCISLSEPLFWTGGQGSNTNHLKSHQLSVLVSSAILTFHRRVLPTSVGHFGKTHTYRFSSKDSCLNVAIQSKIDNQFKMCWLAVVDDA